MALGAGRDARAPAEGPAARSLQSPTLLGGDGQSAGVVSGLPTSRRPLGVSGCAAIRRTADTKVEPKPSCLCLAHYLLNVSATFGSHSRILMLWGHFSSHSPHSAHAAARASSGIPLYRLRFNTCWLPSNTIASL